jgi:hypothetical protein
VGAVVAVVAVVGEEVGAVVAAVVEDVVVEDVVVDDVVVVGSGSSSTSGPH